MQHTTCIMYKSNHNLYMFDHLDGKNIFFSFIHILLINTCLCSQVLVNQVDYSKLLTSS